jgi:hypothetical protein
LDRQTLPEVSAARNADHDARNRYIMERYLVELDGDQVELLSGMVREAIKVADEKKVPALEALLSALGIMSWKAGDRRAD